MLGAQKIAEKTCAVTKVAGTGFTATKTKTKKTS